MQEKESHPKTEESSSSSSDSDSSSGSESDDSTVRIVSHRTQLTSYLPEKNRRVPLSLGDDTSSNSQSPTMAQSNTGEYSI